MKPEIVRDETDADVSTITEVTIAAFKTLEISNHTEQFIIEALMLQEGLSRLIDLDAKGCCVVGHPQFYRKFGFKNVPHQSFAPSEWLQAKKQYARPHGHQLLRPDSGNLLKSAPMDSNSENY
jgi:hypothetical protein